MTASEQAATRAVYLSFMADVNPTTAQALMGAVGQQIERGVAELHLLLSTPGGLVSEGLALYNLLRALPIRLITYNIGSVNSIGNVIFLAGSERYASPASSFMFHGVGIDVYQARFEEKNLRERLCSIQNDQNLIADVIVRHTRIGAEKVKDLFLEAAFVPANDAKSWGLVDDVIDVKVPQGAPFLQLVFQR